MCIAKELKNLRKEKKLTQKDVAEHLDISIRAYQHYEHETREPPLTTAITLANLFDVSLDYLVGRTPNRNSHK